MDTGVMEIDEISLDLQLLSEIGLKLPVKVIYDGLAAVGRVKEGEVRKERKESEEGRREREGGRQKEDVKSVLQKCTEECIPLTCCPC